MTCGPSHAPFRNEIGKRRRGGFQYFASCTLWRQRSLTMARSTVSIRNQQKCIVISALLSWTCPCPCVGHAWASAGGPITPYVTGKNYLEEKSRRGSLSINEIMSNVAQIFLEDFRNSVLIVFISVFVIDRFSLTHNFCLIWLHVLIVCLYCF